MTVPSLAGLSQGAVIEGNAVELFENGDSHKPNAAAVAQVVAKARDKGLILLSCGTYYNVLRVLVPLTAEDELLDRGRLDRRHNDPQHIQGPPVPGPRLGHPGLLKATKGDGRGRVAGQ